MPRQERRGSQRSARVRSRAPAAATAVMAARYRTASIWPGRAMAFRAERKIRAGPRMRGRHLRRRRHQSSPRAMVKKSTFVAAARSAIAACCSARASRSGARMAASSCEAFSVCIMASTSARGGLTAVAPPTPPMPDRAIGKLQAGACQPFTQRGINGAAGRPRTMTAPVSGCRSMV